MSAYEGIGACITLEAEHLVLTKKGLSAKAFGSTGSRHIPFQALAGVNFKDATLLVNGWLQLVIGGELPGRGVASDPNTVLFSHKSRATFAVLRDYLLEVVRANGECGIDPATIAYDSAAATRLEQAVNRRERIATRKSAMLAAGAIRQEERAERRQQHQEQLAKLEAGGLARPDIVNAAANMHAKIGAGREIKHIAEYLLPGEKVCQIAKGEYREGLGIVVLTDSRLLFLFHGIRRKAFEDFPLSVISSVSTKSGFVVGDLNVFASGNQAVIKHIANADLVRLAAALREATMEVRSPGKSDLQPNTGMVADPIAQIAQLAELKNAGALTNEEFEAKKKELLGRL